MKKPDDGTECQRANADFQTLVREVSSSTILPFSGLENMPGASRGNGLSLKIVMRKLKSENTTKGPAGCSGGRRCQSSPVWSSDF